jgi:MFS transporter, ACS family, glucarate transporter
MLPPMRYRVVMMTVLLAAVTYLDRVCIGVLAPKIMADLNLDTIQMSYVFSSFTFAYAVFEIPTAAWADRIGSRPVLTRIVAWWSSFTIITAAVWNYSSLLVIRFLFGAGEAGAWPNAARVFSRWVPLQERGLVQGIFFAGAHLSGGLTPGLVLFLSQYMHWRAIFVVFGCVGFAWATLWYLWFRDEPRDKPGIDPAEAEHIERYRGLATKHAHNNWREVFRLPSIWPLCLMYIANTYGFYFVITWLPTYLQKGRGFNAADIAIFAGLPLVLSVVADLSGGVVTDSLTKRFGFSIGRAGVGAVGYGLAAIAMFIAARTADGYTAAYLIAASLAFSMFTLAPSWAICLDLGKSNSAVMAATMNTSGQIGGFLSPIVLAYLVKRYGDWNLPLDVMAGLYVMATLSWLLIAFQLKGQKSDPAPS